MTVCELVLDIYMLMEDDNLEGTLREVDIPEDVMCRFHDAAPCTDAPVHSHCLVISDNIHKLGDLCHTPDIETQVIFVGDQDEVAACAGGYPACLEDV